jgi:hypothetical protein
MSGYIELTLTNGRGTPLCLPVGSFFFTLHENGGSMVHMTGNGPSYQVDESYEYIVETILLISPLLRSPEMNEE